MYNSTMHQQQENPSHKRPFVVVLAALILLLKVAACSAPPAPTATPQLPTNTPPATPTQVPDAPPVTLIIPETVTHGDVLEVWVKNEGSIPYEFAIGGDENCLTLKDANGQGVYGRPGETCDALEVHIVQPGATYRYGEWDLTNCLNYACSEHTLASPGTYTILAQFFPVREEGEVTVGGSAECKCWHGH